MLPGELGAIKSQVQDSADTLIDHLLTCGSFDAVQDLARVLPFTIVRDMVGLPEFGQDKMLDWAAAAFDVLGVQNPRGQAALPVIAEMRQFIQRDATRDSLKHGSWTHRIHELVDQGTLDAELAPFAIRDYINPSLDTTISATTELIHQLAKNPDQWEQLKYHPELVNNAVNEAVRLGTPIRSFSRHTSKDTDIAGVPIASGSRVMMLFASANRDERRFAHPDEFDITRVATDHVGFGSGVHMCVGMHLAQLEMEAILNAMLSRVGEISTGEPTVKMNNTICAYEQLPCSFARETRVFSFAVASTAEPVEEPLLQGKIAVCRSVAEDVMCVDIVPQDSSHFPAAAAGAHISLWMDNGTIRQYSLTESIQPDRYTIAVQLAQDSRGGSKWVHENLVSGKPVQFSAPKNNFPLTTPVDVTLLIAGGIGITPLLAMAWELYHAKYYFELHVCVRSRTRMPFGAECHLWPFSDQLHIYCDDEKTADDSEKLDVNALIKTHSAETQLFVCGPTGFMRHVWFYAARLRRGT